MEKFVEQVPPQWALDTAVAIVVIAATICAVKLIHHFCKKGGK